MKIEDNLMITDYVEMLVSMSPNLVCCVKRLANMAMKSINDVEISCLAMAAISMSTNAIEAFLLEYSRFTKPYTYTNSFRVKVIFLESTEN